MGDPEEPEGIDTRSSLRFLSRFARAIAERAPVTASLKVMRQWAGCYDVTPDNNPILGAAGYENFLQLNGFVGHGFMMAPAVTELMGGWMAGDPRTRSSSASRWSASSEARSCVRTSSSGSGLDRKEGGP